MGWAISAVAAAIIITFGIFISPLHIGYKVYAYMGLCWITAFLFRFNKWFSRHYEKCYDKWTRTQTISLIFDFILIIWCGIVMFSAFWMPGGAEPFFHDIALHYISALALFIVFWSIVLIASPEEHTAFVVMHCYRMWAYGFVWMHIFIGIMLIIYEGD